MRCCGRPAPSSTTARRGAPPHYRALGRSAYLAAALKADRKLDQVARSFDFLLSISPINTAKRSTASLPTGEERRRTSTIAR